MKRYIGVFIVVFLINSIAFAKPDAFEGKRLYTSYCQLCHGKDGKGDGALAKAMNIKPADLTTTVRSRSVTILKKIITGVGRQTITGRDRHNILSDAMPKWQNVLNDKQINDTIAFLQFLSRSRHKLLGNPAIGKKTYQKYCTVCHGEDGTGDGIMVDLIGFSPADHTNSNNINPLSNADIISAIKDGKGRFMPAWEDVLNDEELKGLVSYIRLLSY
jgi:cbb3-type cytochrome c oxidase subunit III